MGMDEKERVATVGCLAGLLSLLIQFPLFCLMMFGLLMACDAPTWTWVLFWVYIPVGFILAAFRGVMEWAAKAS